MFSCTAGKSRKQTIETVDDYVNIIHRSKRSGNSVIVQECAVHDFEKHTKIKKPKPSLFLRAARTAVSEKWKCDYSLMTPTRFHSAHTSTTNASNNTFSIRCHHSLLL